MKTSLEKMIVNSFLAAALGAVVLIPLRSMAYDGAKGGAQKLMMQPVTAATPSASHATMSCSSCQDKLVSNDVSSKPSVKEIRTTSLHDCGGCGTSITTVGFGKAKADVANHSCSFAAATSCCK